MRRLLVFLSILFLFNISYPQDPADASENYPKGSTYWQQYVHYTINATLHDDTHIINGSETLLYKNNSPDSLDKVYIRLYWNMFTKGSYGYMQSIYQKRYDIGTTGGIWIEKLAMVVNGKEIPLTYNVDNTIAEVKLPECLKSNDSVTFLIEWKGKVPFGGDRTGYIGEDYDVAQWYPQIAVYDKFGWHTDQYLDRGEFYDNYGTFDVNITLPKKFIVAYTGNLLNANEVLPDSVLERLQEAKSKVGTVHVADYSNRELTPADTEMVTWKFHEDSVRDFAWAADPYFIWDVSYWNGIAIHALYFTDKAKYWAEAAKMGTHAISFFSEHFGMYVYKNAFVVEGTEGGGMEYPGLVFIGHIGDENSHALAHVVMHELGHQWYPMMIGSNETENGFQDEGFNTFITTLALESYYGRYDNSYHWTKWYQKFLDFPNTDERANNVRAALYLAYTGYEEPILTHADHFAEPRLQDISIYAKTADIMFMLRYVLGDSVFSKLMLTYYNDFKFKHVYPQDFFDLAMKVSGRKDLRWFFNEWFNRTYTCDYGIKRISKKQIDSSGVELYRNKIVISRKGQVVMPLDIHLYLADGSDKVFYSPVEDWKNGELFRGYEVETDSKIERAEINPGQEILDINRLNNTWPHPKVDFRFDNTMFNVYPNDAYQIRWRPSLWYNTIDGVKYGIRFMGSYLGYLKNLDLGVWYGSKFKHTEFDYDAEYNSLLPNISRQLRVIARAERIEGRDFYSLGFTKMFAQHYSFPPYHQLSFSLNSTMAEKLDYLSNPSSWDLKKRLNFFKGSYKYDDYGKWWRASFLASYESTFPFTSENDYQYSKQQLEFRLSVPFSSNAFAMRLYEGRASGNVPVMTKFYLAQGSPLDVFEYPLLRSKGTLPRQVVENSRVAGGGDVRGFSALIAGDKIDAGNIELRFGSLIPFIPSYEIPFAGSVLSYFKTNLFYDAAFFGNQGETIENGSHFYDDAGVGILFDIQAFYKLFFRESTSLFDTINLSEIRIDLPLYVNKPAAAGSAKNFELRWRLSYTQFF